MPLHTALHEESVDQWLANLLPDSDATVRRWARQMQVGPNAFSLLATPIGLDVAGAVQFTTSDEPPPAAHDVDSMDRATVARQLRQLVDGHDKQAPLPDAGYFSLGGAQPKLALRRDVRGRWGRPTGRAPTTHILKPNAGRFDSFAVNEHLCLNLLARLGLAVAASQVEDFDGVPTLVSTRYDRFTTGDNIIRVHQEDLCQAVGRPPESKYESDGGPGLAALADVLTRHATTADLTRAWDGVLLTWLLGATDIHGKNLSFLLSQDAVALAPAYDVASALPYYHRRELKFAMRLGGEYRVDWVRPRHLSRAAALFGVQSGQASAHASAMADSAMAALEVVVGDLVATDGIAEEDVVSVATPLRRHLRTCAQVLADADG